MDTAAIKLALVELPIYILVTISSLCLLRLRCFGESFLWLLLPTLSLSHIIGSSAQLGIEDSSVAERVNLLLDSLCLAPLFLAFLTLVQRL
jgi:hypothetical protein